MIPNELKVEFCNFLSELCEKYGYEYTTRFNERENTISATLLDKQYFEPMQVD